MISTDRFCESVRIKGSIELAYLNARCPHLIVKSYRAVSASSSRSNIFAHVFELAATIMSVMVRYLHNELTFVRPSE